MEEEKKPSSWLKTLLTIIITIIATLIVLVIIFFTWLMVSNPLNIRAVILSYFGLREAEAPTLIILSETENSGAVDNASTPAAPSPGNVPTTDAQRDALESAGIDPDAIVITPEMESCFRDKLSDERVEEIIKGSVPGPLDIFKARGCL